VSAYSTRLAVRSVSTTSADAYTVGSGLVAVIRDVAVVNFGAANQTFTLRHNTPGGNFDVMRLVVVPGEGRLESVRIIGEAGDVFRVIKVGTGGMHVGLYGYELTA